MTKQSHAKALLLIIILLLIDQITKRLAVLHLKDQNPIVLIQNVFEFRYLENRGAAFGILQHQQWFLIIVTLATTMMIIWFYFKIPHLPKYNFMRFLIMILIAGAFGNMIDRVFYQFVIDFLYFKWIDFPIFNFADIYVSTSVTIFIISFLFYYKERDLDFIKKDRNNNITTKEETENDS